MIQLNNPLLQPRQGQTESIAPMPEPQKAPARAKGKEQAPKFEDHLEGQAEQPAPRDTKPKTTDRKAARPESRLDQDRSQPQGKQSGGSKSNDPKTPAREARESPVKRAPVESDRQSQSQSPRRAESQQPQSRAEKSGTTAAPLTARPETATSAENTSAANPGTSKPAKEATPMATVAGMTAPQTETPAKDLKLEEQMLAMMAFMGINPQNIPQEFPSLAVLTGQLQNVEPSTIPSVISETPLIQNALGSADPAAVIQEVKPLGAWLQDMGWSPERLTIDDPAAFQDLMNTPVSLKEVMEVFQVDVERVVQEVRIMQDTLPLEGAAPYMARAERLQQAEGRPAARSDSKKTGETQASPELMALFAAYASGESAASAAPGQTEAKPTHEAQARKAEAPRSDLNLMPLMPLQAQAQAGAPGMIPQALLSREMPLANFQLQNAETFTFGSEETGEVMDRRQGLLESLQAIHLLQDAPTADAPQALRPELSFDTALGGELSLDALSSRESSDQGQGETQDDGQSSKGNDSPVLQHTQNHARTGNTFALSNAQAADPQQTQQLQQTMKQVFEQSDTLVKEGGGAMRIDLGSQELGALDLSVEVKNNQVEIKINAPSPQARELLAQELPRLREALQNQNLNLARVDIGLGGGSQFTSSDGRSSSKEQSQRSEEISALPGGGTRKSRSYRQVSSTQVQGPLATNGNGSIHVRV